jgi:hypothetical protein
MSARAQRLHATADRQIAELTERLGAARDADFARPCPGRDKLGDGTIGAVAAHTAGNYRRIAAFVADDGADVEDGDPPAVLASVRVALSAIGRLSDEELDAVPAAGAMRFADGERTLEQVLTGLFRHQAHQVAALTAALSS